MKRSLLAVAALFAAYIVLSLGNDPGGFLGTDTGGKVATLRAMARHDGFDPDVGYWAEKWDPQGRLHPLYSTSHVGARWVNATTLPALYVAGPLYRLGGYRAALVVPMGGAVACALAAAALARRLGARDNGRLAFWVIGLASPVTIYALDFWEHTLGLALMAWAVVLLVDLATRRRSAWWALAAGVLFGAAATMRTEALVYGAVATAVVCLSLVRRQLVYAGAVGALVAVGVAVPLLANATMERAVLGQSLRSNRAEGTVSIAGQVSPTSRVREAAITSVGLTSSGDVASLVVGAGVVGAVGLAAFRRDRRALYFAGALLAARTAAGLDFIPGFLVAAPVAVIGLELGWRRGPPTRLVLGVAIASLPLVWLLQFAGGAGPQWGGRYVLATGFLLSVTGVVALHDAPAAFRHAAVALATAVTVLGLAWMYVRTEAIADASRRLAARREPILVSRVAHLVREGGGVYDLSRWLTAVTSADLVQAGGVADAAGVDRIAVIDVDGRFTPSHVGVFHHIETPTTLELLPGTTLRVTVYGR